MSEPAATSIAFSVEDGVVLRGDAWGAEDAPVVLLLHGGGQTRHSWSGTAQTLAKRGWRAIALDQRGHGESDWAPHGRYLFGAFADDVIQVVRQLAVAPVVVGASLGGIAALVAEHRSGGGLCAGLVLVDIAARIESKGAARIMAFMTARPDGFASLEEVADAIAAYNPNRPRPGDLSGLEKNLRLGDDGRYRWHWDPNFMSAEGRGPESGLPDLDDAVRALRVPTLLVRGRQSDLLSQKGADHFLELAPHARFVDVSGAGHMVAGDRNDAFTRAVVEFLATELR